MQAIREAGPNLKSFFYHMCVPSDESLVRGCVVVLHGADGYGGRYEPFGDELVKNGYAMYAIDHIGHGLTILGDKGNLGKWKKKDFYLSAYNAYYLVDVLRRKHPGKPIYLLGDDYGGTMAQYMMGKFPGAFDGIIVSSCGIPTGKDLRMFLKAWFKKVCLYDDSKNKGAFRSRMSFLNSHFKPVRTKYDWMNSDPNEVDRFIKDPLSGFVGTIGYYYYQYKYIVGVPRIIRLSKVNKEIPIMLVGGGDDYITHRGKQINKLAKFYENHGFSNVCVNIYEGSRHDVLLDTSKGQVAEDIAEFINKHSYKETVFARKKEKDDGYKVITLNSFNESPKDVAKESQVIDLQEEEPEDDLRLSNELKK